MKPFARSLRKDATSHEDHLWELLRGRRFVGYRFRRQVSIGPYIADFVCHGRRLIVELDGSQHADDPTDGVRDEELRRNGYRVLRIWNNELTQNEAGVLEGILAALRERIGEEVDGGNRNAD
jgi:very-short-patch-repair endonuclease